MKGLRITRQIGLSLSADDWELYTNKKGVEEVAADLNRTIEKAVNRGDCYLDVYQQATQLMHVHDEYGAEDSEPMRVLELILSKVYGV